MSLKRSKKKGWTRADERLLRTLIDKRLSIYPEDSHDIAYVADLLDGEDGEKRLLKALRGTTEVKTDFLAKKYGTIFIETHIGEKRTGILRTKADNWVTIIPQDDGMGDVIVIASTERMKALARRSRVVRGGDKGLSKGRSVRIESIFSLGDS